MTAHQEFEAHIAEYNDLLNILNTLKWDMRTFMPSGGADTRGAQLATLSKIAKAHFVSDTTEGLLDAAEAEAINQAPDSYRARALQQTRQYFEIQKRIPSDLVGAIAELSPKSEYVWAEARKNDDFASFAPYLSEMLALKIRVAEAIGYEAHPFDALVFEYEPTMTAAKLLALFDALRERLTPLLDAIDDASQPLEYDLWRHEYPLDRQKAFATEIAEAYGFDFSRGRLDAAPHPFEISFTRNDVRIATRYDPRYLPKGLFGVLHETGHALYEQNIDESLTRTALATDFLGQYAVGGASYGAHEASSRLWEYPIGHSRAFWRNHFSRLQSYFPDQLAEIDADTFYRAVNRVERSLVHIDSDEVTYNLHIMLRVEIEMGLLAGDLRVEDLPEIWREKMRKYLGVVPTNDRDGVLQDAHWSAGGFGSFPGYTIGNVIAAQLLEAAHKEQPDLASQLDNGDYGGLLSWLVENFYRHGRAFSITELLERVSGRDLDVDPYLTSLELKYRELYALY